MRKMFSHRHVLFFLLLAQLGPTSLLRAQSSTSLQFIENKGQWDTSVLYSADMQESGFYLSKNGYKVLLRQPIDPKTGKAIPGQILSTHIQASANFQAPAKNASPAQNASTAAASALVAKSVEAHQEQAAVAYNTHVYNVTFQGANPSPKIVPDKMATRYNNYFIGNDKRKWASHCRIFNGVMYKDIYPGVDVRYYSEKGLLKYTLIVHPGADLSRVKLRYDSVSRLYVKGEQLHVSTPVGENLELAPDSYIPGDSGRTAINVHYKVKGHMVSFSADDYDHSKTLVIDPNMVFCSFTGSKGDNWGFTATYGGDGSMYMGGVAQAGFLTTGTSFSPGFHGPGGHITLYPPDIAIIKLTANGSNEEWGAYLGGAENVELPTSLIENHNGDLVVVGHTLSGDFPTTCPRDGTGGNWDIFVSKISNDGTTLMGSIVIGGTGSDGSNITDNYETPPGAQSIKQNYGDDARGEAALDANDNIYMVSCTRSSDFPVSGAFQTNNAGGQDGVVLKVNAAVNTVLWSSYFGGQYDDACYVIDVSPITGQLYVGGGTMSTNLPGVPSSGVIQTANAGSIDGFVTWLNDNGTSVSINKTTYIGSPDIDQVYGLKFDRKGFPYIMGTTTYNNWPVINAAYATKTAGQFVCKLQPDLSGYIYSTTFGTPYNSAGPNISPTAFLVDRCENVYVAGWGGIVNKGEGYPSAGTLNLPVTPDAVQPTTDGSDFYFFVMKKDASAQLYGTYFGQYGGRFQEHVDGGTSRFDQNGIIYEGICANCYGGAYFPTTARAFAPTNGTLTSGSLTGPEGGCNEAGVKIAFNLAGVGSGVKASIKGKTFSNLGCIPLLVIFTDTIGNAITYIWNFGDGSPSVTTSTPNTSHTYTNVGVYKIMLISVDSAACNVSDTSYTYIRAGNNKASLSFTDVKIPPCTDLAYLFTNTSTYAPGAPPFTDTSFTWNFGDNGLLVRAGMNPQTHAYSAAGVYNVQLILTDTNYCNAPDTASIMLHVSALVKAAFTTPSTGCTPYDAIFTDESQGGMSWEWYFGDGDSSNLESPTHLYPNPGTYVVKLIVTDTSTCNKIDSTTQAINLFAKPTAAYTWAPNPPTQNTPTVFTNNSSSDAVKFEWIFGDGDSLVTTSRDTVQHQYNASSTYNACLVAFNANGCSDTACQVVSAIIVPELDVPNAFTPQRFGVNAIIKVRGFGIGKMEWRIYNRWGQVVYESNNPDDGWDGTYKGVLQPMDVYAYTLSVEFTNGTKATKTGDITLLR
jgi:gliding motility-associated-like protein